MTRATLPEEEPIELMTPKIKLSKKRKHVVYISGLFNVSGRSIDRAKVKDAHGHA